LAGGPGFRSRAPGMAEPESFRYQAEIVVAAVRLLAHRQGRQPTVAEAADMGGYSVETTHFLCNRLVELGVVELVSTPFGEHVYLKDPSRLREMPDDFSPAIQSQVEEFRKRRREKQKEIERLFSGTEKRKKDKLAALEEKMRDSLKKGSSRPPL
jgi:hypothetical protein